MPYDRKHLRVKASPVCHLFVIATHEVNWSQIRLAIMNWISVMEHYLKGLMGFLSSVTCWTRMVDVTRW